MLWWKGREYIYKWIDKLQGVFLIFNFILTSKMLNKKQILLFTYYHDYDIVAVGRRKLWRNNG